MTHRRYLTVAECLERLPVKVHGRKFRQEVRRLGLCYRRGHQITLSEAHLDAYIKTLEACHSSSTSGPALTSGKSAARSKSRTVRPGSAFDKARALLD